jgi:hypothetical protein
VWWRVWWRVWRVVDGLTPVEVVEHLICQGAADLTAAERDWMLAIAEFDRREAYLSWAAPTCATWLSQYAGVDVRAARERVRVARALVWITVAHPDTGFEFYAPDGRTLPAAPAVTGGPTRNNRRAATPATHPRTRALPGKCTGAVSGNDRL